ncbi:hypothetical protein RRG08_010127, partial [Elysia crispata]
QSRGDKEGRQNGAGKKTEEGVAQNHIHSSATTCVSLKLEGVFRIMGLATRVLLASLLMVMDVRAQSQGLELSLDRDIISMGDQEQVGELTCKANGNDVTVESVSVIWVNITGESSDVVTVTTTGNREHSVALDGILGNGTLENNSGYIVLNQMDAQPILRFELLSCVEVTFTKKPSGERERAIRNSPGPANLGEA